jgi:hypothetical protein
MHSLHPFCGWYLFFVGSVRTRKTFKKQRRKPPKGVSEYRLIIKVLITFRREPAVLAYQPREVTIPANLGQLVNQQEAGTCP